MILKKQQHKNIKNPVGIELMNHRKATTFVAFTDKGK